MKPEFVLDIYAIINLFLSSSESVWCVIQAGMEDIWKGRITSSDDGKGCCFGILFGSCLINFLFLLTWGSFFICSGISNASLKKEEDKKISSQSEENALSTGEVSTICGPQTQTLNGKENRLILVILISFFRFET